MSIVSYELHLIGLVLEECKHKGHKELRLDPISHTASITTAGGGSITHHWKRTFAQALADLLKDLGVEVPDAEGWGR